ncbi:MAG TPA: hypothetical protein VK177_16465 [Flavobacteriales bacterium]|nr:hypothetical protein [Flavobacteriales bacterium]
MVQTFIRLNLAVMLAFCFAQANAAKLTFVKSMSAPTGSAIVVGDKDSVEVSPKNNPGFTDIALSNYLTLSVNQNHKVLITSNQSTVVIVQVTPYDTNNVALTPFTETLSVAYNPTIGSAVFTDRNTKKFAGAWYKFVFEITSIKVNGVNASLPHYLTLEGKAEVERIYHFNTVVSTPLTMNSITERNLDCDGGGIIDEIEISWQAFAGAVQADEYQLEWTFINDYDTGVISNTKSLDEIKFNFRNNATRISTTNTYYYIPLLFDRGYLIYRVRAVGYDTAAPTTPMFSAWNVVDADSLSGSITTDNYYYIDNAHEADKNWQVTTTFAEEGKKKEVVSYFDGSLRNRQTVTRINSDNKTIVGETIYDYQGRPAVTVLPVPVPAFACFSSYNTSVIRFFPNFNVDTNGIAYDKSVFDIDDTSGYCTVIAPPMYDSVGASNYYSVENGSKSREQAFVPDANDYPFTQVEYTNDNTGRIRKQGGVGQEFQLGNGHETGYLYGQPNQIQLDRMFGSEVGDATHYKKNVVIDPNGQASVSYLDQEGRVVATALAGDSTTNLHALPSSSNYNGTVLTVDLFNKNAEGESNSNTLNADNTGIEFHTELLVAYQSNYEFDYAIEIDTLADTCFKENVCINCVYNLEIEVLDECGLDMIKASGDTIQGLIGHFALNGNELDFVTTCHSPSTYDTAMNFTLNLDPGVYTVVKKLSLNLAWRDSVVAAYLDTAYNHCVMTLQDFIDAEMDNIDTSGCHIDCDECVASLGTRDDYVASGKGTAMEYDFLVEQCQAPCESHSLCQNTFQQMLIDVSPSGQYAEFQISGGGYYTYMYPLSLYNDLNVLSANRPVVGSIWDRAWWRNPQTVVNGTTYPFYFEEDGNLAKIYLTVDVSGYYQPLVYTNDSVKFDAGGLPYIYPQHLAQLKDFINLFKPAWAKALVTYHPEYCYYETCNEYEQAPTTTDTYSSEEFDELMRGSLTWYQAVNNGLINATTGLPNDWFTFSSTDPYDPFVTNGYGTYGAVLENKFDQYVIFSSGYYSMVQQAAIMARCGTSTGLLPSPACTLFGTDHIPGSTAHNTEIRNAEWGYLRDFYLSAKHQVQNTRADQLALTSCYSFNDCIGNDDVLSYQGIMWAETDGPGLNQWYHSEQPCSPWYDQYYHTKTKRFPDVYDVPGYTEEPMEAAYQMYLTTGQCPIVTALEDFLGVMADSAFFTADTVNLLDIPQFNAVYLANNNYAPYLPITSFDYTWQGDTATVYDTLHIDWVNETDSCIFEFYKTGSGIVSWDDIIGFSTMQATSYTAPNYHFTINAQVEPDSGTYVPYQLVEIEGITTCYEINDCEFPLVCEPTQIGNDLALLISVLAGKQDLTGTGVALDDTLYAEFVTTPLYSLMGLTGITGLTYTFNTANNTLNIVDPGNPANRIVVTITGFNPGTFTAADLDSIGYFDNFNSLDAHYFTMDAHDTLSNFLATVTFSARYTTGDDSTGINIADCDQPEPLNCANDPYIMAGESLYDLVKDLLLHAPFDTAYTAASSAYYTTAFQNLLPPPITPLANSYEIDTSTSIGYETWTVGLDSACSIELTHDIYGAPRHSFEDLITLQGPFVYGTPDAEGLYHQFYYKANYLVPGHPINFRDTIIVTSCIGFKPCKPCVDTLLYPDIILNDTTEANDGDGDKMLIINDKLVHEGKLTVNSEILGYVHYKQALEAYNASVGTARHAKRLKPVSLGEFRQKGLIRVNEAYLNYLRKQHDVTGNARAEQVNETPKSIIEFTNVAATHAASKNTINTSPVTINTGRGNKLVAAAGTGSGQRALNTFTSGQTIDGGTMLNNDQGPAFETRDMIVDDTCLEMYEQYVQAYNAFQVYQLTDSASCDTFQLTTPFISLNAFMHDFHLCCTDNGGYDSLMAYLVRFDSLYLCPGLPDTLGVCDDTAIINTSECWYEYVNYVNNIAAFNNSSFAASHGYALPVIFNSYDSLAAYGGCECVKNYNGYIQGYIYLPWGYDYPAPVDLAHFEGCFMQETVKCDSLYYVYYQAVNDYNLWADSNDVTMIGSMIDYEQFYENDFCYCVQGYVAYLYSLTEGLATPSGSTFTLMLSNPLGYCTGQMAEPCTPNNAPPDTLPEIPFNYVNPCVQYQVEMATVNATTAYNQYIDSLTTYIANKYTQHCLNALETFTNEYTDKEYHFTLYYYDQAGNLVKTVPPQGVQLLSITSPSSPLEVDCIEDRTNGTQQVFTSHVLATRYEYNSLNQLVKQTMPDHDNMSIWENKLCNGLDSNLTVTSVQFVDGSQGYLTGTIPGGFTSNVRGVAYKTNDAGETWQKLNLAATNFKKIQMIDSLWGYAIGTDAVAYITRDGGTTWDVLSNYWSWGGALYNFDDLTDMDFYDRTHGIFTTKYNGYIRIDSLVGSTSIPKTGYARITPGAMVAPDYSTSVVMDNATGTSDNYFMSINDTNSTLGLTYNTFLRLTTPSGSGSGAVNTYTSHDIKQVSWIDTSSVKAFACGTDGSLLYSGDRGVTWIYRPVNLTGTFKQVYFRDFDNGVAIIEDAGGNGYICATHDNGLNWTTLSDSAKDYNAISPYAVSATGAKLVAVGENGAVSRVLAIDGTPYGIIDLDQPNATVDLTACFGTVIDNKVWIYTGGNTNKLYRTKDADAGTTVWTSQNITSISAFNKIAAQNFANHTTSPCINGAILAGNNLLYKFYKATSVDTIQFSSITINTPGGGIPTTTGFNDVLAQNGKLYALNNSNQTHLYYSAVTNSAAISSVTYVTSSQNINSGVSPTTVGRSIALSNNDRIIAVAGDGGRFERGAFAAGTPGTVAWVASTEPSANIKALPVKASDFSGTIAMTCGDNGQMAAFYYNGGVSQYYAKILTTGNKDDMNEIDFTSSTGGYTVGNGGKINAFSLSSFTVTNTAVSTPVTVDLHDISVSGTAAYVAGDNGTILYTTNITTPGSFSIAANVTNDDLYAVEFVPTKSFALAAGDHAHIRWCMGTNAMTNKNLYQFSLNDLSTYGTDNIYIVGNRLSIKHSVDGGDTWSVVKPSFTAGPGSASIHNLNAVKSMMKNQAVVVGTREGIWHINNNTLAPSLLVETTRLFNDVDFAEPTRGYAVGANSTNGWFKALDFDTTAKTLSLNGSIVISSGLSGNVLNCIQAFKSSNTVKFVAFFEGHNGLVWYGTASNSVTVSSFTAGTTSIKDVFFHDNEVGYVVGTDGAIFKNTNFTANKTAWTNIGTRLNDSLNSQLLTSDMDIRTIGFSSRTKGFIGGLYNGTASGANNTDDNYARIVKDESGYYSTLFWYDRLGRIVVSQNTRQFNETPRKKYSYTLYDALGRVAEAGEKTENHPGRTRFAEVPGTVVNNFFNPLTINDSTLGAWINDTTGARREVTMSYYDEPVAQLASSLPGTFTQENLRKRIATVMYEEEYDYDTTTYTHATHYTYDIHGNVNTLLQDNKNVTTSNYGAPVATEEFKRIDYDYDLISGNVHEVDYQKDSADQWMHRYEYDADNRITQVETSDNGYHWDRDAKYLYYDHGPLARTELGNDKSQGIDYAYTLQGWIKGVNSNQLTSALDMGRDNYIGSSNANQYFGKDVCGYTLNYFAGDYKPIDYSGKWSTVANRFEADKTGSDMLAARYDLYNGNIGAMVTTISDTDWNALPQATSYQYDQLNRIMQSRAYTNLNTGTNVWSSGGGYANRYYNAFTYDANGNILTQQRHRQDGTKIEELSYGYKTSGGLTLQNRLYHVDDAVFSTTAADDIDDMGIFNQVNFNTGNNYRYDEEGRLIQDLQEEIADIEWRVDGKVKSVERTAGSSRKNLIFEYDAMGNRIAKHMYTSSYSWIKSTYYVRDAQGNVLATYDKDTVAAALSYQLKELDIYGSSRVGLNTKETEMIAAVAPSATNFTHVLGKKQFEISNHLGNVLEVITDRKYPVDLGDYDSNNDSTNESYVSGTLDGIVDQYKADIVLSRDYSPFGVTLDGRTFNRQSCDTITTVVTDTSLFDDFPGADISGMIGEFSGNIVSNPSTVTAVRVIGTGNIGMYKYVDLETAAYTFSFNFDNTNLTTGGVRAQLLDSATNTLVYNSTGFLSDGNYSFSVPGITAGTYKVQFEYLVASGSHNFYIDKLCLSHKDTTTMIDCDGNGDYRYAFNGQEHDDEIKGEGNSYDFGARLMDSRLGRWLTIDKEYKQYPGHSNFSFGFNNPIYFIDYDGRIIWDPIKNEEIIVTYDANGAPTLTLAGGGPVSDQAFRHTNLIIAPLANSDEGKQLISDMMNSPTKITFYEKNESNDGKERTSGIDPKRDRKGVAKKFKFGKNKGLFKEVNISPNLNAISKRANKEGIDYDELVLGVMTIEIGHLETANQIVADEKLLDLGYGFKPSETPEFRGFDYAMDKKEDLQAAAKAAYENLFAKAAAAQGNYRVEKGQAITDKIYIIGEGAKTRDPMVFQTTKTK